MTEKTNPGDCMMDAEEYAVEDLADLKVRYNALRDAARVFMQLVHTKSGFNYTTWPEGLALTALLTEANSDDDKEGGHA